MPRATTPEPQLAVVVATYARATLLPRLVAALERQQDPPPFELVVVDDASPDDTWEVLQRLAADSSIALRPLRLEANRGPATARNLGWRSSAAALIVFTDDDCAPEPGWLRALADGLAADDIAQGRTIPDPLEAERAGPFSRSMSVAAEDGFYQTCNVAYRRTALETAGGFDETFRFPAGEDTELAWRVRAAGGTTCFRADAVVRHTVRPSRWSTALRDTWRWQSMALAVKRNPQLRALIFRPHIWRRSHALAIGPALGLYVAIMMTAVAPPLGVALGWVAAGLLCAPYAYYRLAVEPLPSIGRRRRILLLPAAYAIDGSEVIACLVGSVRHRRFVL